METLLNKVCSEMVNKLQDLEKKAQHDVVYYKGAREAVILVASELTRKLAEQNSGRPEQQPAQSSGPERKQSSFSEIRKERAKRQKATDQAE